MRDDASMLTRLEHARANVADLRRAVDWYTTVWKDRATVVEPLFDTPYGTRKFTIADPDGNELGFVRTTPG